MASLYSQPKSQFFWLKYRRADGSVHRFSTRLSRLNPADVRRARQLEAEYTLKERACALPDAGSWLWVKSFLETVYTVRPRTRDRYLGVWENLRLFLDEAKIEMPAQLTRQHCFDYVLWRAKPDQENGKYRAGHNTVLLELKVLRIIMSEAVVREFCTGNPCVKLKLRRAEPRRCPELTDEQIGWIRDEIAQVADARMRAFYEITFEIGRWQGCRINATQLNPMKDVTLNAEGSGGRIFFRSKGKEFETMLHPRLIPLFQQLKAKRRRITWEAPTNIKVKESWASLQWTRLLEHSGLKDKIPGVCFRSFRVSVATRMARKNVPISKAKDFLKHASTTVHFSYQRLTPEDLTDCAKAIE